jgi:hypothetical protein
MMTAAMAEVQVVESAEVRVVELVAVLVNEFSLRSVTVSDSVVGRRRRSSPACRVAEPGSCDDFTISLIVLCVF